MQLFLIIFISNFIFNTYSKVVEPLANGVIENGTWLVVFGANYCPFCKTFEPIFRNAYFFPFYLK